jgi:hypothetical protein
MNRNYKETFMLRENPNRRLSSRNEEGFATKFAVIGIVAITAITITVLAVIPSGRTETVAAASRNVQAPVTPATVPKPLVAPAVAPEAQTVMVDTNAFAASNVPATNMDAPSAARDISIIMHQCYQAAKTAGQVNVLNAATDYAFLAADADLACYASAGFPSGTVSRGYNGGVVLAPALSNPSSQNHYYNSSIIKPYTGCAQSLIGNASRTFCNGVEIF